MSNLKNKPPAFHGGQALSAKALNDLRAALPRLLQGGKNINIRAFGDRFIIDHTVPQGTRAGTTALVTIRSVHDGYLVCDRDGADIMVAKPWTLRRGVEFPAGPSYEYHTANHRTATQGEDTEEQYITPTYEVGEELLVMRVPSSHIEDGGGNMIVWVDMNNAGRAWAVEA
jgi:hypothetical protein